MRVSKDNRALYASNGRPLYWSARADDAWRATPEANSAPSETVQVQDGVAVLTIDTPICDVAAVANRFFNSIRPSQSVRLDINSPGGIANEGTAIRSMMLRHEGMVVAQVLGVAASAAQLITTGADEVWMAEGSHQMIHRPWSAAILVGDYERMEKDSRAAVEYLKTYTQSYEKVIAKKMKIPQSRVAEMLKSETWLTAEDAVAKGLATKVYPVLESVEDQSDAVGERPLMDISAAGDLPTVEELVQAIRPAL